MSKDTYEKQLNAIFRKVDPRHKKIIGGLIRNAAFMRAELEKLQEDIEANGMTEEYKNGENQYGRKKRSEVDIYNVMIKNYAAVIRQLFDMAPAAEGEKDELLAFIKR